MHIGKFITAVSVLMYCIIKGDRRHLVVCIFGLLVVEASSLLIVTSLRVQGRGLLLLTHVQTIRLCTNMPTPRTPRRMVQMAHTELRFSVSSLYGDHLASCTHLPAGLGPCTELNNFRRGSPPGCLNAQLHETIANTTATLTHLGIRGKLFYAQTKHAPFARFATWLHAPRRARTLGRAHSLTSRQQHLLF